jgi:VWFA-related protein
MRRFLAVVALLAAVPAAAQAPQGQTQTPTQTQPQTAAPAQGPTFKTGVDVVTVDVAVVDSRGNPVEDLRAPEFTVKIDGETRRVVSAELIKIDVEAAKKQVADKSETFFTTNITPTNGRTILIAVDQTNIRPGSLHPVMEAAQAFLDHLSPLDQVGFIAYPEPGRQVNFTRDRLRLKLAMRGLIGESAQIQGSNFNIGVTEAMAIYDKRDQVVLAGVVARECQGLNEQQRAQCEREIIDESAVIIGRVRQTAQSSLTELRNLLTRLAILEGPKALILISEGLAIEDENEMASVVALAGRARTSIHVMSIDLSRNDITIIEAPPTMTQDRRLQLTGLEALAMLSRGSLYHIVGSGGPIFDRLASEISAHYLLGVEQRPGDAQGDRHRIDISVNRRGVTIRSRQAFVLSPTQNAKRSADDSLRDALISPFSIAGLPLRVTTYAQQDPASGKVQMLIAADVDQPGAAAADYTIGFLVVDDQNKVVTSWANTQRLSPSAASPTAPLAFLAGVALEPGNYSLRLGAVDAAGRRGMVIRDVAAWKLAGEELATGDLFVGTLPTPGKSLVAGVEPHVAADGLAAYIELYSTSAATFDATAVQVEIADNQDGPALLTLPAQLAPGKQATWRVATAVLGARPLPPGPYVARAKVTRAGKTLAVLTRPFVLEAGSKVEAAPLIAARAVNFAGTLPPFDRHAVTSREFMTPMLDAVEKRSPALKDAVVEARAGRYGPAALEALTAGDQEAASFLRGLDLFIKGQLDQAATQLQLAAGPRRDFFPAAFYLGAAFAAVGRDRDAAGVWQIALGTVARPTAVYLLVADARLRDGQAQAAIDILKPAFQREPASDPIATRLGMAYLIADQHSEAIPVIDAYLTRRPADQDYLLAAIVSYYEASRAGMGLSNVDRARLKKYGAAYKGPQQPLVGKYLDTMAVR